MTPNSKRPKDLGRTDEFKRRAVETFLARGDKPVDAVAAELGVNKSQLYEWGRRMKNGEPLTKGTGPRGAEAEAQEAGAGRDRARRKPGVLMRAQQVEATQAEPSLHIKLQEIFRRTPSDDLTISEREELVLLRAEARKLKRALVAYMEL